MINMENSIPKWLQWTCGIPFSILFLPVGILYTLFVVWHCIFIVKVPFKEYKHDLLFLPIRPGFYIGFYIAIFVFMLATQKKRKQWLAKQKAEEQLLTKTRSESILWLKEQQIQPDHYYMNIYISKDQAIANINIIGLTPEEKTRIDKEIIYLPAHIRVVSSTTL